MKRAGLHDMHGEARGAGEKGGASARGRLAVAAENLSKSYLLIDEGDAFRIVFGSTRNVARYPALKGVTIRAPKGRFVGVLGRNGAGKTTLLRTLGGVLSPDGGVVAISGEMSAIYELGVAGNPFLTGRQYAERMLEMRGVPRAGRPAMLADIVEFSELGERVDDQIQSYSTGMAARLFFAVATAGFYEVYLIDEVLSVGDQYFQAKCWRRIRQRLEDGASGVLVTHDWTSIVKVCSEAVIIEDGRCVFSGAPEIAVRRYLYGDDLAEPYERGVASFVARPEALAATQGGPLRFEATARLERDEPVYATVAIERLRVGAGWETVVLSREPTFVGDRRGDYAVAGGFEETPLPPGDYVVGLSLVQPRGPREPRRLFDGFGWLGGSGVPLVVEGAGAGVHMPGRWRVETT